VSPSIQDRSLVRQGCISPGVSRAKVTSNTATANASRSLGARPPNPPRTINSLKHLAFQTPPDRQAQVASHQRIRPPSGQQRRPHGATPRPNRPFASPLTPTIRRRRDSLVFTAIHPKSEFSPQIPLPDAKHSSPSETLHLVPSARRECLRAGAIRRVEACRCRAIATSDACTLADKPFRPLVWTSMHEGGGMRSDSLHAPRQLTCKGGEGGDQTNLGTSESKTAREADSQPRQTHKRCVVHVNSVGTRRLSFALQPPSQLLGTPKPQAQVPRHIIIAALPGLASPRLASASHIRPRTAVQPTQLLNKSRTLIPLGAAPPLPLRST
jgi:hypothetical protein